MPASYIASFRERQTLEETSIRQSFTGPAVVARHKAINVRATRGATYILHLVQQRKHAEARACLELPDWGFGEEDARNER